MQRGKVQLSLERAPPGMVMGTSTRHKPSPTDVASSKGNMGFEARIK